MSVNESIGRLILTWINHFGFSRKVSSLADLADGDVFVHLIKVWLNHEESDGLDIMSQVNIEEVDDRYELIGMIVSAVHITSGINYELAKRANQFELAKIAFIILINGVTKDIPAFVAASEKLETTQYEMTNHFFFILEKEKMSFPPVAVKPYEEFLCTTALPGSVTPSKDTHSPMLRARESMNSSSRRSGVAANLLLSPLKAIALSSPRGKSAKNEEHFHNEKRRLEREIHNKELHIYDLTDQLKEREEKFQKLELQLDELKRKLVQMNGFREKAYEHESLLDKIRTYEKENATLAEKCKQYAIDSDELAALRKNFDKQQLELGSLSEQLSNLEKKDLANEIELLRLKRIESELIYLKEVKADKEKKILQLIQEKGNLETQLLTANENISQLRSRYSEQVEELSGENALTHNKLNSVYAQMGNLKQELEDKIKTLENELFDQKIKYKSLEQSYDGLQDVFNEAKRNFTAEASELNSVIETMKNQNNALTIDNSDLSKKLEIQIKNLSAEKEKSAAAIDAIGQQLEAKKRELVDRLKDMEALKAEMESAESQHKREASALRNELADQASQIRSLQNDVASKDAFLAQRTVDLVKMAGEKQSLHEELNERRNEVESLHGRIKAKDRQLAESAEEKERLASDLAALRAQLAARLGEIEQLKSAIGQKDRELAQLGNENAALTKTIESLSDELTASKRTLACETKSMKAELVALQASFEETKARFQSEMEAKIAEMAGQQAVADEERARLQSEVESKASELVTVRASRAEERAQLQLQIESLLTAQSGHLSHMTGLEQQVTHLRSELETMSQLNTKRGYEMLMINSQLAEMTSQLEDAKREAEAKQTEMTTELNALKHQLSERAEQLGVSINELEARKAELKAKSEENVKYVNEIVALRKDMVDKASKAAEMEKSHTQEVSRLKKFIEARDHTLDNKIKECESLKFEMEELKAKSQDYEQIVGERNNEIKRLVKLNEDMKADYGGNNKLLQSHINTIEQHIKDITKDSQVENEEHAMAQKRLREDLMANQSEVDTLKLKLRHAEDKEKLHVSQLEEANEKMASYVKKASERERERYLEAEYESMKQANLKLKKERNDFEARCKEVELEAKTFKDYGTQLDQHYQKKKAQFENIMNENTRLKGQMDSTDKRLKHLTEEMAFLKEKMKTVNFENQTLRAQKEELTKRISEMPLMVRGRPREDLLNEYSRNKFLNTPSKVSSTSKYYDDSYIKYSSPGMSDDEALRRSSMARQAKSKIVNSRIGSRLANEASTEPLNRCYTISEHEFEDSSQNSKSFHQEEQSSDHHRLSVIQARNQQAKPHLKSSYPLEDMGFSENQIRAGQLMEEKENTLTGGYKCLSKRAMDSEIHLSKKTFTMPFSSSSSNIPRHSNL